MPDQSLPMSVPHHEQVPDPSLWGQGHRGGAYPRAAAPHYFRGELGENWNRAGERAEVMVGSGKEGPHSTGLG